MSLPILALLSACYLSPLQPASAQSISTSTPVPPLQWINLTGLLTGPSAPPLKDASIGYDNTSRTLILFGGESQGGLPQQQTYLSVLPFLTLFALLNLSPLVSTLTLSTGPPPHLKVERLPHPLPQEVPPSGAVILQQASISLFLLKPIHLLTFVSQAVAGMLSLGGKVPTGSLYLMSG